MARDEDVVHEYTEQVDLTEPQPCGGQGVPDAERRKLFVSTPEDQTVEEVRNPKRNCEPPR